MLIDFETVKRAQSGEEVAFNEVVTAYRRRILATVSRLIGRPEDVEDVAQEVFLRLYYSLDQLRSPEVFEPWLYRLTVNASLDHLRRRRRRQESRMADLSEQQVVMADAPGRGRAQIADSGICRLTVELGLQRGSNPSDLEGSGRSLAEGARVDLSCQ
jgi:RNA polymerase sigma-70 factor (ECF subfamily)